MKKRGSKPKKDVVSVLSLELEGVSSDDDGEVKSISKIAKTDKKSKKDENESTNESEKNKNKDNNSSETSNVSTFEWYLSYKTLGKYLKEYFEGKKRALYVGCGTSTLGYDLCEDADVSEVINIDTSEESINAMAEKYSVKKRVSFETGDVKKMRFKKGMFDLIIDKGTFDEMMCSEDCKSDTNAMLKEIFRVLSDNGVYIIVSNACEELRVSFFCTEILGWTLSNVIKIQKPFITSDFYYVYVLSKVNIEEQQ